jgi:hypothetical protein
MSGYDKSSDYGGPDPSPRKEAVTALVLVIVAVTGAIWALRRLLVFWGLV